MSIPPYPPCDIKIKQPLAKFSQFGAYTRPLCIKHIINVVGVMAKVYNHLSLIFQKISKGSYQSYDFIHLACKHQHLAKTSAALEAVLPP